LIHRKSFDYLEINQFSLAVKKRNLELEEQRPTEEQVEDRDIPERRMIGFEEIFLSILGFFEFINFFYDLIGYHGYCRLDLSMKNILNVTLNPHTAVGNVLSVGFSIAEEYLLPEKFHEVSIPIFKSRDDRLNLLLDVCQDIARTFGSETDPFIPSRDILRKYALAKIGN
jgi:hypothetical protein